MFEPLSFGLGVVAGAAAMALAVYERILMLTVARNHYQQVCAELLQRVERHDTQIYALMASRERLFAFVEYTAHQPHAGGEENKLATKAQSVLTFERDVLLTNPPPTL